MDQFDEFEAHRDHLRAVAYRMLGSASDVDDALQEAWLRLARADTSGVRNTRAWLTTVVARVCLDMLRSRTARREVPLDGPLPAESPDPQQEAMLAESVGLALMVVLDNLTPAERLAFVLHDMFALPFDEIAPILGRSTAAAKMLASRARHRVRAAQSPDTDMARQRRVVDAFLTASRNGDFAALLDLLDPEVAVRADAAAAPPGTPSHLRGAHAVARQALAFSHRAAHARTGLVNGAPAILVAPHGRLTTVMSFTFTDSKIMSIDIVANPQRLSQLAIESA
ncbi:sigma-70 family RNA polymerase sigma factor [Micromonospora sp. DT47]|uniref:sigma-70 family RNA polymerase sigma factor n=1 Tax=Micromonospora sp. DT47 TaxID=3393431 RepID=UPI003CF1497B